MGNSSPTPAPRQQEVINVSVLHKADNIAAIDFGTTSLSLAYVTKGDDQITTLILDELQSTRISNAILFERTENGTKVSKFGDMARNDFAKLKREHLSSHIYMYFERIKMILKKDKTLSRDTKVKSFTGEEFYLLEVIAFILKYLKNLLIDALSRTVKGTLKTTDFDWVITVPAIWDARGKRMMREAAYLAGLLTESGGITQFTPVSSRPLPVPKETNPHKLSLALEPEAAALYSREVVANDFSSDSSAAVIRRRPSRYMVIDIGGGTVDITAHVERDGGIVVENIPTGNDWGGTKVNEAFSKLLQDLVGDEGFKRFMQQEEDSTEDYGKLMVVLNVIEYVKFELEKKSFGNGLSKTEISIDLLKKFTKFYDSSLIKGAQEMKGVEYSSDDDILYISKEVIEKRLFGPAIEGITSCILLAIEESGYKMDTFYLVGGFGGCKYIYEKVQDAIQEFYHSEGYHINCRVIVPKSPSLAVAQGAVMWRKNPQIVKARKVDASYGVATADIFDRSRHDSHYRYYDTEDAKYRCHSWFSVFRKKGDLAQFGEAIVHNIIPHSWKDTQVTINIYSTPNIAVMYTEDKNGVPTVTNIGQLVVQVPNPRNLPNSQRKIDIAMDFSSTEIKAKAKYRLTGEEVEIVCDFLSAR